MKPARDHSRDLKLRVMRKQIREHASLWGMSLHAAADALEILARQHGQPDEIATLYREARDIEKREAEGQ